MDSKITLSYGSKSASTIVSNNFIDKYMTDARGSDVKVYIYLLRCVQNPSFPVSIESIAEALGETEKEIRIALKYWDEQHVLSVSTTRNGKIKDITLHDLDEDDDNEVDFGSNVTILSDARRNRKSVPEPAPATMSEGPSVYVTASRWEAFNWSKKSIRECKGTKKKWNIQQNFAYLQKKQYLCTRFSKLW